MGWFKRSSQSNGVGVSEVATVKQQRKSGIGKSHNNPLKRTKKYDDHNDDHDNDNRETNCEKRLSYLNSQDIEIIDPELFFHDPEHVRNYREEAQFLQLMSEWEIIENPATMDHASYFSADFEEEFLQMRTQGNEEEEKDMNIHILNNNNDYENDHDHDHYISSHIYFDLEGKSKGKSKIYEFLFADHIQMGIALPKKNSSESNGMICKRRKFRKRIPKAKYNNENLSASSDGETWCNETYVQILPSITTCSRSVIKNCEIDREQLKTEALACSIMGAIGKCPNKDSSTTSCSSDNDLITSNTNTIIDRYHSIRHKPRCDHYDIKEFFHLDDYGNILLNISHIIEFKGHGFKAQCKRTYRRYRKECQCTEEDMFCQQRGCCIALKRIFLILCHMTIGHPRNKISPYSNYAGPGDTVRAYTLQLAQDECSTFARNIENFISCTKDSREAAPQVVMRNMRQFMNGMKNYLVKHGEGKFQQEVDAARGRLKSDEFLNLDAILETVMHQLVVLPLREHLYGMFVDYYTRSEDIQLLAQNVKYACGRNSSDFGIRSTVTPPSITSLTVISNLLLRLQEAELPLDKLELFLCVISTIFDATGCPRGQQLGADDFLPILVYVVAKCGFVGAEIEAEFMWGLLQPTLLNGEPGYYLTALCSAVHVLKSFMASENESGSGSLDWRSSSLPACSSVLRVIIPDECNGSLQTRTLPVRPHTTTREVCRIIAHKARITNPQDYALFKLVDGEETLLNDIECPQDIRLSAKGKHCMLAYKRIDAKIAWPTATQPMHN